MLSNHFDPVPLHTCIGYWKPFAGKVKKYQNIFKKLTAK